MKQNFRQLWEEAKEKAMTPKLYIRKGAFKLLGFKKSAALTDWLRENDFMDWEDMPAGYLIKRGIMQCCFHPIYFKPKFDSCGFVKNGVEYDIGSVIRYVNIPLFTERGIEFFKQLLKDPAQITALSNEIKLVNKKQVELEVLITQFLTEIL